MLQRLLRSQSRASLRFSSRPLLSSRTIVTHPKHSRDTIVFRDPERPLPPLPKTAWRTWGTTLPIFVVVMAIAAAAIFNYEKSSSSVVNSTLYALRTHPRARELLGDEIYFRDQIPWVWGELNTVHGNINVSFAVKGTKDEAFMTFKSTRQGGRMGKFETEDWSLEMPDGRKIQLLDQRATEQFQKLPGTS